MDVDGATEEYGYGFWVDAETKEPIGGEDGKLEFTVISCVLTRSLRREERERRRTG
jgi:hypothetical protein